MTESEDDKPHKPADDSEQVYYSGSPLLRAETGKLSVWWLCGLAILVFPIVWKKMNSSGEWPGGLVILACLVMAGLAFVLPVLLQKTVRYRISNYRIDYERGLLSKNIDTLELWHVEDIKFHQSLIDRILNTGTITVISHDETTPKLILQGLPDPRPLFETLKQRVIAVKRQRGVIKMDVG